MNESDKRKYLDWFHRAREQHIDVEFINGPWTKSQSHVSFWTHVKSYVQICTEGLSEHLIVAVLAHELGHVLITKINNLKLPSYYDNPLLHEKYAWKIALENENIELNPEFYELAQLELNRYIFAYHRCLNETTDRDAQLEETKRLNGE